MSHTALTVPSMNELLKRRFDVTVTVARDGSYLPDPAAFSIAAEAAAATRPVTGVMSAHCPDKIIAVVTVERTDQPSAVAVALTVVSDALRHPAASPTC